MPFCIYSLCFCVDDTEDFFFLFLDIDDIEKHMPGLLKVIVILNDYIDNALIMKVMEIMCFTGFY